MHPTVLRHLAAAVATGTPLVPAVMALLGRRAWWLPRRLDRLVSNLDIEGERVVTPADGPPAGAPRGAPAAALNGR